MDSKELHQWFSPLMTLLLLPTYLLDLYLLGTTFESIDAAYHFKAYSVSRILI
jgi:hypothetical protein